MDQDGDQRRAGWRPRLSPVVEAQAHTKEHAIILGLFLLRTAVVALMASRAMFKSLIERYGSKLWLEAMARSYGSKLWLEWEGT